MRRSLLGIVSVLTLSGVIAPILAHVSWAAPVTSRRFERKVMLKRFYRGNTHTHTLRSDGDSSPETVIEWYRRAGYHFLVMTDHNRASVSGEFANLEIPGVFKVVAGEEVTFHGIESRKGKPGFKFPVHVNALCPTHTIAAKQIPGVKEALNDAVQQITSQTGAVAQINHPNFHKALRPRDFDGTERAALMEIANQHVYVDNEIPESEWTEDLMSVTRLWDVLLMQGRRLYGTATDDVHHLKDPHTHKSHAPVRPGKGWIQVAADSLDDQTLCRSMEAGDFYASTGVELSAIRVSDSTYSVRVAGHEPASIRFVVDGVRLEAQRGPVAHYTLKGNENYVRAEIEDLRGRSAWTQPAFTQ